MENILTGVVLRKTPITDRENINPVFRAEVRSTEGDLAAIIKRLPEREIEVECLCATLGRAMGLPIPKPMVLQDTELGIVFGSEEMPHPDLKRAKLSEYLLLTALVEWDHFHQAQMFDEWIANPDRHGGNLLTNGIGDFWLIDHGLSLPQAFDPEQKQHNHLLDMAIAFANDDLKKQRLIKKLSQTLSRHPQGLEAINNFDESMLKFLTMRSPSLYALLRKTVLNHDEIPGF